VGAAGGGGAGVGIGIGARLGTWVLARGKLKAQDGYGHPFW